jgi:hypothetical protein
VRSSTSSSAAKDRCDSPLAAIASRSNMTRRGDSVVLAAALTVAGGAPSCLTLRPALVGAFAPDVETEHSRVNELVAARAPIALSVLELRAARAPKELNAVSHTMILGTLFL